MRVSPAQTSGLGEVEQLVAASSFHSGHGVGSSDPWIDPLRTKSLRAFGSSYHPTEAGMRTVADAVIASLRGGTEA